MARRVESNAVIVHDRPGLQGSERGAQMTQELPKKSLSRRRALRRLGCGAGAVALGATGGALYRAYRQGLLGTDPSLEAWGAFEAGAHSGPLRLVSAAILAASPHNTQPWRFRVGENAIEVEADFGRRLEAMDPFEREMFIGLGCALENMAVAAPGAGLAVTVALTPRPGERAYAARVAYSMAAPMPHPLEVAIAARQTNRGRYDTGRRMSERDLATLRDSQRDEPCRLLLFRHDSQEARRFAALTLKATEEIIADPEMSHASARWYRHSQDEIVTRRDGLTLQTVGLPAWLSTVARIAPPVSEQSAHDTWLKSTRDLQLATADHIGMIAVAPDAFYDDRISLLVGRLWQRFHLAATLMGVACQPINQIPERISRERQLALSPATAAALAGNFDLSGWLPTFCFRIGYPTAAYPHSPRRTVAMVAA
jgi:nitroreductase